MKVVLDGVTYEFNEKGVTIDGKRYETDNKRILGEILEVAVSIRKSFSTLKENLESVDLAEFSKTVSEAERLEISVHLWDKWSKEHRELKERIEEEKAIKKKRREALRNLRACGYTQTFQTKSNVFNFKFQGRKIEIWDDRLHFEGELEGAHLAQVVRIIRERIEGRNPLNIYNIKYFLGFFTTYGTYGRNLMKTEFGGHIYEFDGYTVFNLMEKRRGIEDLIAEKLSE